MHNGAKHLSTVRFLTENMSNDMDREACVTPVAAFTEAGNGSTQLRISMDKHTRNSEKFISSHESLPSSIKLSLIHI